MKMILNQSQLDLQYQIHTKPSNQFQMSKLINEVITLPLSKSVSFNTSENLHLLSVDKFDSADVYRGGALSINSVKYSSTLLEKAKESVESSLPLAITQAIDNTDLIFLSDTLNSSRIAAMMRMSIKNSNMVQGLCNKPLKIILETKLW